MGGAVAVSSACEGVLTVVWTWCVAAQAVTDTPIHTAARDFEPLQVLCKVNGFTLPAVVDTGAQVSVMTSSCAQRCRISPFIDTRYVPGRLVDGLAHHAELLWGFADLAARRSALARMRSSARSAIWRSRLGRRQSALGLRCCEEVCPFRNHRNLWEGATVSNEDGALSNDRKQQQS